MSQPRIAVVLEQVLSPRSQDDRHEYLISGLIKAFIGGLLAFNRFRSQLSPGLHDVPLFGKITPDR